MALSPLGVLDLSLVTDRLIKLLTDYIPTAPLWGTLIPPGQPYTIHVSGSMPETKRKLDGCQLTVSLIHVSQDKFQRNSAIVPTVPVVTNPPAGRAQVIPNHPLSLDLYYLVTAYADDKYVEEQQAMSIVLNCFHQTPIVKQTITLPGATPSTVPEEFTLTMEIETCDELARLWQAITVAYRMSVVYKVSVVFLTPPAPAGTAKPVLRASLAVDPAALPYQQSWQVIGTLSSASYATPASTAGTPEVVTFDYSPATVVIGTPFGPGTIFSLLGGGLNQATSNKVYLLAADPSSPTGFSEQNVSSWLLPNPMQTGSSLRLQIQNAAALPSNAQNPGVYQLRVGNNVGLGSPGAIRSNATPFSIAAPVNVTIAAPNPPLLTPDGSGIYTVKGVQFVTSPNQTQVLLETVPLTATALPLQPGTFNVGDPQTITFKRPTSLPSGTYAVRIRVNQVESPPGWWIQF